VRTTIAFLIAIPFIAPFLLLIGTAFRTQNDYLRDPGGLPRSFTFSNLTHAWSGANLGAAVVSTLITCVVACAVCGAAALAGAFWFRVHQGKAAGWLRWMLVSCYAIPTVAWLIPLFVAIAQVGLSNSRVVTGAVDGVSSLPFAFYLIHTYFRQVLEPDLLEAATLDGAGPLRTFRSIAVPLAGPVLASVTALVFVWTFGDLLIAATLLQSPSVNTLTLATAFLSTREDLNLQEQAAAALVALLPTLLVFLAAQKTLARGFGATTSR
jgi:ABC-type glycerol-3-phosphate transport system permease component